MASTRVRRWRRRKPVKKATIFVHRWISLVLGLLLLLVTTTGALVVYTPEWTEWTNQGAFEVVEATPNPIPVSQALAAVAQAHPGFDPAGINKFHGIYEVTSADPEAHPGFWGVDPSTGGITGYVTTDEGVMAFMNQIHECFFTCDTYPGYVSWMNANVPTLGISFLDGFTWSALLLGVTGLMLLFLAVSGVWLWYPTIKKWRHGFRIRTDKGRYARDYDLHQVVGMVAVPFLLMWGLTGASFEMPWVTNTWYFLTGGHEVEEVDFVSAEAPAGTRDIGTDAAETAARQIAGPGNELDYAQLPTADDATSTYYFYFDKGMDQYEYGSYPGNLGVAVDRHDATRTHVDDFSTAPTLSNQIMDNWGSSLLHYGIAVNGWWRIIWFLFGLTPLFLAVTGVSTWLAKRSVRRTREEARRARAAAAATSESDGDLTGAAASAQT